MQEVQRALNIPTSQQIAQTQQVQQQAQLYTPTQEKQEQTTEISPTRSPTPTQANPVSVPQILLAYRQQNPTLSTPQFASFPLSSNPSQFNIPSAQSQYNTLLHSIVNIQQKNQQTFATNAPSASLYTSPTPFTLPNTTPNTQFNINGIPSVFRNEISGPSFPSFSFTTQFKGNSPTPSQPTVTPPPPQGESPDDQRKKGQRKGTKVTTQKNPVQVFFIFTTIRDVLSNIKDKTLKTDGIKKYVYLIYVDILALIATSKNNVLEDLSLHSSPMKFLEIVLKFLSSPPPGPTGVATEPCIKQQGLNQVISSYN